jgi:MFS family permease
MGAIAPRCQVAFFASLAQLAQSVWNFICDFWLTPMLLDRPALFIALIAITLLLTVGATGLVIGLVGRLFGRRRLRKTLVGAYGGSLVLGGLGALASVGSKLPIAILLFGGVGSLLGAMIGAITVLLIDRTNAPRRRRRA